MTDPPVSEATAAAKTAPSEATTTDNPESVAQQEDPPQEPQPQQDDENDWQVQRDREKSCGDNAFRAQDFSTAIYHYSAALSLDPTHHIILSNRSAAYLSSHQTSRAFQDAQACVEHSPPDYFKGYSRLAAALQSLGRYGPAKEAWQRVLSADPKNAAAQLGLENATKALKALEPKEEEAATNKKAMAAAAADDGDEGDDLDDFFDDVETATEQVVQAKQEEASELPKATHAIRTLKRDLGTAVSQIERLLETNYEWRNLNPFFVLLISPDATEEEISRRYKALSLLLHPDKHRNNPKIDSDQAELAYDQVQKAKTMLLADENKAKHCRDLAKEGMRQGKRDWEQQQKETTNNSDKDGSLLEDLQTKAIMKIFAQMEYKRREVDKRQRSQDQRERSQEEEEVSKERSAMKFEKNWKQEGRQDKRVGNWRDFQTKKKPKP